MKTKKVKKLRITLAVFTFLMLLFALILTTQYIFSPNAYSTLNGEILKWDGSIGYSFAGGNGSIENPYLISDGATLAHMKSMIEQDPTYNELHYELSSDIDLDNKPLETIGNVSFKGTFDGNGYTIANIKLVSKTIEEETYTGLFNRLENAQIYDLNLENVTIDSTNPGNKGSISGTTLNSEFRNITIINSNIQGGTNTGILSGQSDTSIVTNVYLNGKINSETASIGSAFGLNLNTTTITKLITKVFNSNDESIIIPYSNIEGNYGEVYYWDSTIEKYKNQTNEEFTKEELILELNMQNPEYMWQDYEGHLVYEELLIEEPSRHELMTTAVTIEEHESGIENNTVYVNDYAATLNYYYGLNYTEISGASLPVYQNLYNISNLVPVAISYSAEDFNDSSIVGHVSPIENENKYVYYRYYPIENGQITIDLIDNPFSARPTEKAFNGWATSYSGAVLSFDKETYTRTLTIPAPNTNQINIEMKAVWTVATIKTGVDGLKEIKPAEMVPVGKEIYETRYYEEDKAVFTDGKTYYEQQTVSRGTVFTGWQKSNNSTRLTQRTNYTCNQTTCTIYVLTEDSEPISNKNYYFIVSSFFYNYAEAATFSYIPAGTAYEVLIGHEFPFIEGNSAVTYYYKTDMSPTSTTDTEYYYNEKGENCSTVTCSSGNTYKLLQNDDDYALNPTAYPQENYYFLATRDTNIVLIDNTNESISDYDSTYPFTLTASYNGSSIPTNRYVRIGSYSINSDRVIENIVIYGNNTTSSETISASNAIDANRYCLKIGRNVTNYRGSYQTVASGVFGSTASTSDGTATNPDRNKVIVESGRYAFLLTSYATSNSSYYINYQMYYGSDYDRVTNNDTKLIVYFNALASAKGNYNSGNTDNQKKVPSSDVHILSGSYGITYTSSNGTNPYQFSSQPAYGVYVGGRSSSHSSNSLRRTTVWGGRINALNGGPCVESNLSSNSTALYMLGGYVRTIYGGAAETTTYGNRIISITGGTVGYSVSGGSNASQSTSNSGIGELSGKTLIYIGGDPQIGDESLYDETNPNASTNKLFNTEIGDVFGAGNGKQTATDAGRVISSHIIIDKGAKIYGSVYGGGNYGVMGYTNNTDNKDVTIEILGGTIENNVYGGGNNNGVGSTTVESNVYITVKDGIIKGSIYGGSNAKGTVYGSTDIKIEKGLIGSIYGGGLGGYESQSSPGTFVAGNVDIAIGDTSIEGSPEITGPVYGGSAFGTVNTTSTNPSATSNHTYITVNKGTIRGAIYGGGEGKKATSTTPEYSPVVSGEIKVTINDGNLGDIYGGCNLVGVPLNTVDIYINGGLGNDVFGGGNRTGGLSPNIIINGGEYHDIFGGSNNDGTVTTTNIQYNNATANQVFGGNNAGGRTENANVIIESGTINEVYGGGNSAPTGYAKLEIIGKNQDTVSPLYVNLDYIEYSETPQWMISNGLTTRPYYIKTKVQVINPTNEPVTEWIATLYMPDSDIYSNYSQTDIEEVDSDWNFNYINKWNAYNPSVVPANGLYEFEIELFTSTNPISLNPTSTVIIPAQDNDEPTVTIDNVYGGGKQHDIENDTDVTIFKAHIKHSAYGGGNQGAVLGNATITVGGASKIDENLFAGGNSGSIGDPNREANKTTDIIKEDEDEVAEGQIDETLLIVPEEPVDESDIPNKAILNLVSGTIGGNVYGGCNTSKVFGETKTNIGLDATGITDMERHNIIIRGTIFGGGEANSEGDEKLDYNFISVTKGIDIQINGNGYLEENYQFEMHGSIFGSGNSSSSSGISTIYVKNLGTRDHPNPAVSIQRSNIVTLDNTVIDLSGDKDKGNHFDQVKYSISRVNHLKLINNAVLMAQCNTNLLRNLHSIASEVPVTRESREDIEDGIIDGKQEILAQVNIDENTYAVTKNVDNRLYSLANKFFYITTNQQANSYGKVYGMTFYGMYTKYNNGSYQFGMYSDDFETGSNADAGDVIIGGSYVLGQHKRSHDIKVDGFYTNYIDDSYTRITTNYIEPTPPEEVYYQWTIGLAATNYEITLTASRYSSLGTTELSLREFIKGDTIFNVLGFNSEGLTGGISLVDSNDVPVISRNLNEANSILGLSMKSETTEWTSYNTTKFLSANKGEYRGDSEYKNDSQGSSPSLMFYLYHAKNISLDQDLGSVVITMQAQEPINEFEHELKLITITINLVATYDGEEDEYDASITYNRKYEMPSLTNVNITNRSQFTAYFALFRQSEKKDVYGRNNDNYHTLVSNKVLPVGTKITMIDIGVSHENPNYYYYQVTDTIYQEKVAELTTKNEVTYKLQDFTIMGSTTTTNKYDDAQMSNLYFDPEYEYAYEEFLFIFDFENTTTTGRSVNNSILFELRNNEDRTVVTVLGMRQDTMKYNLYDASNITLLQNLTFEEEAVTHNTDNMTTYETIVNYDLNQNQEQVIDTNYESNNMGINVTFYDLSGNKVSSSLLEDTYIKINNNTYHADSGGVYRIRLANKVSNLVKNTNFHIGNSIPTGTYNIKIRLFASDDGLYSTNPDDNIIEKTLTVLGNENAIIVDNDPNESIITLPLKEGTKVKLHYAITKHVNVETPNIRIAIFKRNTGAFNTNTYSEIHPNQLFENSFSNATSYSPGSTYEYVIIDNPPDVSNLEYRLISSAQTGTYKIVFRLYNRNYKLDEVEKYIIVKSKIEETTE